MRCINKLKITGPRGSPCWLLIADTKRLFWYINLVGACNIAKGNKIAKELKNNLACVNKTTPFYWIKGIFRSGFKITAPLQQPRYVHKALQPPLEPKPNYNGWIFWLRSWLWKLAIIVLTILFKGAPICARSDVDNGIIYIADEH